LPEAANTIPTDAVPTGDRDRDRLLVGLVYRNSVCRNTVCRNSVVYPFASSLWTTDSVPGFALITAPVLTFLFTGRCCNRCE